MLPTFSIFIILVLWGKRFLGKVRSPNNAPPTGTPESDSLMHGKYTVLTLQSFYMWLSVQFQTTRVRNSVYYFTTKLLLPLSKLRI